MMMSSELENIDFPEDCVVHVAMYQAGHSMLLLQVESGITNDGSLERIFIMFNNIIFFNGPLNWKGFQIFLGRREICEDILKNLEVNDLLFDNYCLYNIETNSIQVSIVASNEILVSDSIPKEFERIYPYPT